MGLFDFGGVADILTSLKGWRGEGGSQESSDTEDSLNIKQNVKPSGKSSARRKNSVEEDFTDSDANDMIDIMERALEKVKTSLSRKMGKLSKGRSRESQEIKDLDNIESFIHGIEDDTVQVVSEINKVMQIMAQVTVDLTEEEEEDLDKVEDINDSETVVGRILEDEGDNRATENWKKLVRKLSKKRQNSLKKKRKQKQRAEEEQTRPHSDEAGEEMDDIPEDWRPDFIPREVRQPQAQPDLVQTSLGRKLESEPAEDKVTSAIVKYRSDHRRYLQREMGRMKRNSLVAETVQEEEEGEEQIVPMAYTRARLTM